MENYFQRFVENLEHDRNESPAAPVLPDASGAADEADPARGQIAARLAVYDSLKAAPRVVDLGADDYREFIELLASKTYQSSKEIGGKMPYTIIRETIENLIHAYFQEVVISVLDNGNTVRISDQGPGIHNKDKAFEPGFSTATADMKRIIRGVGSGLPITRETLSFLGGAITIEDNLRQGTVITLKVPDGQERAPASGGASPPVALSNRQAQILFIIMELGSVGPSRIAGELDIGLSTAHRDLVYLEKASLIYSDEQGKRALTPMGVEYLDEILKS